MSWILVLFFTSSVLSGPNDVRFVASYRYSQDCLAAAKSLQAIPGLSAVCMEKK